MKRGYDVRLVHRADNLVGECPLWHGGEGALYWVDTRRPALQRLDRDGAVQVWELPHKIGSFVFRRGGGLIAAMQIGFVELDLDPFAIRPMVDPEPDLPDNRMNDGKCDPQGRFWVAQTAWSGCRPPRCSAPSWRTTRRCWPWRSAWLCWPA